MTAEDWQCLRGCDGQCTVALDVRSHYSKPAGFLLSGKIRLLLNSKSHTLDRIIFLFAACFNQWPVIAESTSDDRWEPSVAWRRVLTAEPFTAVSLWCWVHMNHTNAGFIFHFMSFMVFMTTVLWALINNHGYTTRSVAFSVLSTVKVTCLCCQQAFKVGNFQHIARETLDGQNHSPNVGKIRKLLLVIRDNLLAFKTFWLHVLSL